MSDNKKPPFEEGDIVTTSHQDSYVDAGARYTVSKCFYEVGEWVINTCDAKCSCTTGLRAEVFTLVEGKKDREERVREFKQVVRENKRMLEI